MRPASMHLPQPRTRRFCALLFAAALLMSLPAIASADAPPGPYFNGFETNTAGWSNFSGATITRVPSGSSSTYANGVAAATGAYYARLGIDPSPDSCTFGGCADLLRPVHELRGLLRDLPARRVHHRSRRLP